jgi:hypothetical protein
METKDDVDLHGPYIGLELSVERQAQQQPDRLDKPRTRSVWTDQSGRIGLGFSSMRRYSLLKHFSELV